MAANAVGRKVGTSDVGNVPSDDCGGLFGVVDVVWPYAYDTHVVEAESACVDDCAGKQRVDSMRVYAIGKSCPIGQIRLD